MVKIAYNTTFKNRKSRKKEEDIFGGNYVKRKLRKERNVLFNYALNTFYIRLYSVGYIIKDQLYFTKDY